MNKYLSTEPIWHESSEKLSSFDGKSILIVFPSERPRRARVHVASELGEVFVEVTEVVGSDVPWTPIATNPLDNPRFAESNFSSEYLSKDALDLIRPHNDPSLHNAELLLVLPIEP